ncbi:MAG TPA: amino acid adenylation domain-containing protein, partial [Longimicrobium sp.]|nr:amino acid adenylation domain-containing protein [Longimicrobium sp.]
MQVADRDAEIAVIGMSCRLPGARTPAEYWSNLCAGVESISFFSEDELLAAGIAPELVRDPSYVRAYGAMPDAFAFDAPFFGVNPAEAQVMDPQQRVFLESAWSALEDAGCDPARYPGAIGVYAGSGSGGTAYQWRVMANPEMVSAVGGELVGFANGKDFLTTRVSYKLGLRGPSVVVQTACSTSLVAIHLACQSLLNRECDLALAGGVTISPDQERGYRHQEGGIVSPDGHCRAFDARAAGTVSGSGAGVVVLKRMVDALRDGDTIRAVVKGSATNNDGADKIGFTAPSVTGQAQAISEALAVAAVDPSTISYVEAHGTGTALGDPIEIAALTEVFRVETAKQGFCALGAAKTNIGHVDSAAGVAGFIKTVLALEHRTLPPTLHFETPNPETGLDDSPFYVNTVLRPWERNGTPRRAGVSSFGMGGTNAHVVLEEAPEPPAPPPCHAAQLLVLSARGEAALERMRGNLAEHLAAHPGLSLADVAHTLQEGRAAHPHRWAAVARDREEARAALSGPPARQPSVRRAGGAAQVAFLFPGQGTQYAGMARELYAAEPVFREQIDRCAAVLAERGMDLRAALFPPAGGEAAADALLGQTGHTQPVLFAVEYALAQLWMSWGVRPSAMLGHSIGEYVAASLAGVFSPDAALRLVEARGRLMQGLEPGSMLAVPLPEAEVRPLLGERLSLAAVNSAAHCVVSGGTADTEALEARLAEGGVAARRLHTSHAFHSAAMDPVLDAFAAEVRRARPAAPATPYLSNVTGDWITPGQAVDPAYWVRHLRETVRFADGAARLLEEPGRVLLEVGPGETLGTFVRRSPGGAGRVVVKSLPRAGEPGASDLAVLEAAGALWTAGVELDWAALRQNQPRRRVPLPTYPFDRTVYRVGPPRAATPALAAAPAPTGAPASDHPADPFRAEPMRPSTEPVSAAPCASPTAAAVAELFARLLGRDPAELHPESSFLELGADSLLLMQASRSLESRFGVKVPFRQLLDGLSTMGALSAHLEREAPLPAQPDPAPAAAPARPADALAPAMSAAPVAAVAPSAGNGTPAAAGSAVQEIIAQQLAMLRTHAAIMQTQLELLRGGAAPAQPNGAGPVSDTASAPAPLATAVVPRPAAPAEGAASHGPHRPVSQTLGEGGGYTGRQARHFDELVRRYTARTRGSKAYTAENRPVLADNRASLNFRMARKELLYPIVGERSQGSRLWDVDGNEYIDFTIGFGVHFFGHRPPFVVDAVEEQLRRGFHLGPQSDLAGPAARLFSELTGVERVTFCNTGSEAIMTAVRMARTVTGRDRIVMFEGSYHGCFDGILARGAGASREPGSRPVAPGTPQGMIGDVVVLEYGSPEALEYVRANAAVLAAVLVEPVQNRNPEFHPREFLRELRALTARGGTVLIFDEMITGLRLQRRGAQGFYGVEADLATYGKVIGGGFPLGVVAGRAAVMDAIDGGTWSYGDGSYPAANQTFFAGTFCKHPVTMAAACAVLRHLAERGDALYDELNARTARLVAALREVIAREEVPMRILSCASLFHFRADATNPFVDLLLYHMLERGIYIWEGRACFLSTAHTDDDCDRLVRAFRESVQALREGGFLPEKTGGGDPLSGPGEGLALPADLRLFPAPEPRPAVPVSFPLTPAQKQIWVHTQLGDDASRAYNEQITLVLREPLDPDALRAAVGDLMEHHEALRTVFDPSGEVQHVRPSFPVPFRVSESGPDGLAAAMNETLHEVFDLAEGPLFRVHAHVRGPEHQVVQLVVHHLLADGFSGSLLKGDLAAAYRARRAGEVPRLPPAMQFSEYAALLAEHTRDHADNEEAWLARFRGTASLAFPWDRPRPRFPTHRGGVERLRIGAGAAAAIREAGRRQGCTLFATLLAGVLATLHRAAAQGDFVIGVPSAGRPFAGSDTLVGDCADLLPIRSVLPPAAGVASFLKAVRGWLLDAAEHEVFAYTRLQEKLGAPRGPGDPPLISLTFNLEPRGPAAEQQAAAPAAPNGAPAAELARFAKMDLIVDALELGDELELVCLFNRDLLEHGTVRRLLGQVSRVLEQMASNADTPLSALELLDDGERRLVLEAWNDTAAEVPAERCIHELFEAQAARTPGAVAVRFEETSLTYAQLNARANQLAHHLRGHGVGPEVRVGVLMERSLEMVVSLLAVLKAGGAYVPLDPGLPAERLAYMLDDSAVPLVLVQAALRGAVSAREGVEILAVDALAGRLAAESEENPAGGAGPDSLAYVIYTSGSTGRPKGVMNQHRGVINRLAWMQAHFRIGASDVVLQKTPFGFDVSVWEFFWPLQQGARLVMARPDGHRDPLYLRDVIEREGVTTLHFVPSMLQPFVEAVEAGRCGSLRHVVCSGEALPPALVRRFHDRFASPVVLTNLYGPTEAAVDVSCWTCPRDAAEGVVPIGRPVWNTALYVLDAGLRPMPVGTPGELYIGGVQVARGYQGRAAMTAERFVPDPFSTRGGARLYRSGDRARWRADGAIEYLGRLDFQVKVRGFRIEPGEIEAALRQAPGVSDCAVVAREDEAGDRRLVAYVVGDVETDALRAHVRRTLPEYMVPSAFVCLDALPLTPNGKLDRKALPAPELAPAEDRYVAPRTPAEEVLAGIWAEVLRLERVGVEESFFELGGHSLLATRVISRVRQVFGVEVPLRALFEGPTLAEMARAVEDERRRELPVPPPVVPVERTDALPLSFAQERLWFVDRLEPGSSVYNIPVAWRLGGGLDVAALERALGEIVRRHESLRTTFAEVDGSPVQVIAPFGGFSLPVEELSGLDEADREAAVRRRAAEEARRAFDLSAGPLFRAALLRLGEEDHVLLLSMHHVVSDGWSMGVLRRELSALYAAYREGGESPLPELAVQYADYAVWQREQLSGEMLDRQLAYWRDRLAGAPELLELPTDHLRPPVRTYRGASVPVELSLELLERLQALGRSEGTTLYMTLLGAFQVLLSKYGAGDDVVVGSPIAGRTRAEVAELIGLFVNTLVLRTHLSGDPSFREVLGWVREATLGAYEHQEVPFEKLVAELQPERSLTRSPLFQVLFTLDNADGLGDALAGLKVSGASPAMEIAKLDLSLILAATPRGLRGALNYSTDLFERGTIERMVGHLARVLEQVAADADVRLLELELLGEAERSLVLEVWNDTAAEVPADRCIHELFEAQAARTPDALAVEFQGETLDYRELNGQANQLAHHLAGLGVGPETRVAICLERGPEMVVSILAVLKAGGAYVPLDPAYPAERLAFMLADAAAPVLVTQELLRAALPAGDGVAVVSVDGDGARIAAESAANPERRVSLDQLAYVIYTSGSTGTPKGVMVPHRGVPNLAYAQARRFGIDGTSRVLQFASPSFDAAVAELFDVLLTGATLVLAPREELLPGAGLLETLRRGRVTVATLPPSVLAILQPSDLPELRTVVSAGEAVDAATVERWSGGRTFVNAYGPTETTVCATSAACEADGRVPAIGRALENVRVYVLDAAGRPAPVGVPGELYVGGVGVARGYLGRPGLTAERFVPDAFGGEPGARLYRTGDRARWRADGTLEYLGRLDGQVKVRGFRIEPGEIEAVLRRHEGVADCVVVAREDAPGEKRLVAYVVGQGEAGVLREHLLRELPEYMVPAAFVPLERLPLTVNGKLDRRVLPAPEYAADADRHVAPRTPVEEVLAGIFAEVLGLERVGVEESFFELGGHSLLATMVVSWLRELFDVELPVRELFEGPTVAELANAVEEMRRAELPVLPPVVPTERTGALPLSFAQERLWFIDRLEPGSTTYNIPAAWRLGGVLNERALERALGQIVRRHESLRTTFAEVDGSPVQVIAPFGGFTLPVEDLSALGEADREAVVRRRAGEEAARPFDLAAGPLFRAALLRLGEEDHVLLLSMHHVVSDGWSMGVLRRELSVLYAAYREGRESPLAELAVQYADYAAWQREQLAGEVLDRQLAYWKERLGGAPELLELPTDHPRPPVRTYRGEAVPVELSLEVLERLQALGRSEGATLYMTLLSAFQVLLGKYAGSDDVVVGSPIAGRTRGEVEGLIGFFVNTLVLRTDLGGDPSFREVLRRVREVTLGAYEHQDVPFEKLVAELQPERSLSHSPLFQVSFTVQDAGGRGDALPGLKVSGVGAAMEVVKFDLSLTLAATSQGLRGGLSYSTDLFE